MSEGEPGVTTSSKLIKKEKVAIKCHLLMSKLSQAHDPGRLVVSEGHEKLTPFLL